MILSDNVLKKRVFKQQILDLHLKDFMIIKQHHILINLKIH